MIVSKAASPAAKRRILVVDASPLFREFETVSLARVGVVVPAASAAEAFEALRREGVDLIVADTGLPDLPGDELCRRVKGDPDSSRIPVVLIAGAADGAAHERAVRAEADDVLPKPLKSQRLVQAVERLLQHTIRGRTRVDLDGEVDVRSGANEFRARIRNLSRSGLFIETAEPLVPSTEVALRFRLPGDDRAIEATARSVWRPGADRRDVPAGMGLQFLDLSSRDSALIDDFVDDHSDGSYEAA